MYTLANRVSEVHEVEALIKQAIAMGRDVYAEYESSGSGDFPLGDTVASGRFRVTEHLLGAGSRQLHLGANANERFFVSVIWAPKAPVADLRHSSTTEWLAYMTSPTSANSTCMGTMTCARPIRGIAARSWRSCRPATATGSLDT